ncbi:hypothetical protein GGR38_002901 [Novosphingobium sediminicola]|uniref:Uncharacterized protein n=1 Tax=Novosphingobium sediminicola TaxID=563162 RepID=A0A7W6G6N4_9SPHN|nr:hypothetical protein [Novosphingobium sediminicola]
MQLSDLDKDWINRISNNAQDLPAGFYSLSAICGEDWRLIDNVNSFSRKFRRAVELGSIPNVSLHTKKSKADILIYIVKANEICG